MVCDPSRGFLYKTVPHIARHRSILDAALKKANAELAAALKNDPHLRTRLVAKLAKKQKEEGKRAITDADRRRRVLPPDNRPATLRFVFVLLLVTVAAWGAVWASLVWLGPPHPALGLVFAGVVVVYIAAVAAAAFRFLWNPVLAPYPPCEPSPDAIHRRCQSFGLGIVNMSGSVHVAADAGHLHLTPLAIWRALGARQASIPWLALVPVGESGRIAQIGSCRLEGPEWCMRQTGPTADEAQDPELEPRGD